MASVTVNRLFCMQGKSSYILWLPSWYPNELDPFDGDFIQRHAHAASLRNNIHVIFVKADREGKITDSQHESFTKTETLSEHVIYFKKTGSLLGRFNSFRKWIRLFKKAVKEYIKENGILIMLLQNTGQATYQKRKKDCVIFHFIFKLPGAV